MAPLGQAIALVRELRGLLAWRYEGPAASGIPQEGGDLAGAQSVWAEVSTSQAVVPHRMWICTPPEFHLTKNRADVDEM